MRFPVSFAQQRLWFLEQLSPGEPTYNRPHAFWLDGPLDPLALQRALDVLVARHAVLRTSIVGDDGVPEQVVADSGTVPIERIELPPGLDAPERTRKAESIAAELSRQPFDLAAAPLIRTALIVGGPDRHLFVLVMHHSISDGASMKILTDELSAVYRAETAGPPASLPPLWMEYSDFALWQQDRMRGEELERQLGYWRQQLRGAPQLISLPTGRPRPARRSSRGGWATTDVDAATTERLAAVAHDAHCTMFTVFLTGLAATLSRCTRQADLVLGTQVTDRTHAELDPLVGLLTNTLALRISLAGDPTFTELLGRVRDTTEDALAHRQLPFEKLVADLAPDRTLAHPPLIQAQFEYGSLTPPTLDLPGIATRSLTPLTSTAKLDLSVYADAREVDDAQVTRLSMEYRADLFDADRADRFLGCLAALLEQAADAPGTPVADLPMPMPMPTAAAASPGSTSPVIDGDRFRPAGGGRAASSSTGRGEPRNPVEPRNSVEPRNPVEATLARIWGDLLDPPAPVGVHDNLFALGGHSLTATRFVARLGGAYGVPLPVHQVFASPTIAQLAEVVAAHPEFNVAPGAPGPADLDALSDDDLEALLRAALAQRNRRRAIADGSKR